MKLNHNLDDITPLKVETWDFSFPDFIQEGWDNDQLFLVEYKNGEISVISYGDFIDSVHLCTIGAKSYRAINILGA